MRKVIGLVLSFLVVGVIGTTLLAQSHDNMTEKKASDELTLSSDILVAGQLLKAGRYRIECDRDKIKFFRIVEGPGVYVTATKVIELPCTGKVLEAKRTATEMFLPVNKAGVKVLEKLYLRGSNVEHVFPAS